MKMDRRHEDEAIQALLNKGYVVQVVNCHSVDLPFNERYRVTNPNQTQVIMPNGHRIDSKTEIEVDGAGNII